MTLGPCFPGCPLPRSGGDLPAKKSFPEDNLQVTLLGLYVFKVCRCHSLAGKWNSAIGEKKVKQAVDEGDSSGVFPGLLRPLVLEGAITWTALYFSEVPRVCVIYLQRKRKAVRWLCEAFSTEVCEALTGTG